MGTMDRCMALSPPASPQNRPDRTKAASFVPSTSNPQARARVSFSRMASRTAPKGDSSTRERHHSATDTKTRTK